MIVKTKHSTLFTIWCVALLFILPIVAAALESRIDQVSLNWSIYWKWFIFWCLGIRLFLKGIRLASISQVAGLSLSSLKNRESYPILLEPGFANIALGSMGILSVLNDQWRLIAAIAGGIYFALADMLYFLIKPGSRHELVALVFNLLVLAGLVSYLVGN